MVYNSQRGYVRVVAVGDAMPTRGLTKFDEPDYLRLVDLVRSADVAVANLETTVRRKHEGNPNATTGTVMSTPPDVLSDLKWMGVNLVSAANNHTSDYGVAGMVATMDHLEQAGMPFAGIGSTLTEARAPGFLDTKMGRVALVSATTFFAPHARGGDSRPDSPGRPGVNPLRFSKVHTVDERAFRDLTRIKDQLGLTYAQKRNAAHFYSKAEAPQDGGEEMTFADGKFRLGSEFTISTSVHAEDARANLRQIEEARRRADWVIFALHNHEMGEAGRETAKTKADMEEPAAFAIEFARAAIDAGADMVVGHGPHIALGVEVYKGRPIFHSLGNFILQNETVGSFPADAYVRFGMSLDATPADFLDERSGNGKRGFDGAAGFWLGLAAECEFNDRRLSRLILHPLDLGYGTNRAERGRPVLARGDAARVVLERVKKLSDRFGGKVEIEGERAVVSLG